MATSSQRKDIDDKFCLCSICLEQIKEPKLLPCLHRYCKDCLNAIIQGTNDIIICPECRQETQIPANGVDGIRTDFYSKNLVEYVQIQQSLKSDEVQECYNCSRHLVVAAYCFKCKNFLCKDCHNFHVTNETLKDHQKHTLSLEDIEAKNITIEKLASMRDAPRCLIHLEEIAKLCCETCVNLPVCMACTYGNHKGHSFYEVTALAKLRREELTQKLKALEQINKGKCVKGPKQVKEKLILNVSIEREKVIKMYQERDEKIMRKIQGTEERRQQVEQEKQNTEEKVFDSLQTEVEREIQGVEKNFEDIFRVKKLELNDAFKTRGSYVEKEVAEFHKQHERFERDKKELLDSIEKQLNENMKIIEAISQYFDNIKKRFETLNIMASNILASNNDWLAVQCIPDMCTTATNLMKDLKKDFPELTTLTKVTINYKQYSFGKPNVTKISENFDRISINHIYKYIFSVTSSGDGNIVISGIISNRRTPFIIVIDMNGKILMEKTENTGRKYQPARYCKFLSQHKVASICEPNETGVYDMRDGSYIKKNIIDVVNSWPIERNVSCVATDPVNNHILVGGYSSRDVYVFDDQLNYLHILTLPEMIKWPRDMTVRDCHLLVCDYEGEKCYVTTMDGLESRLMGKFMKPTLEGNCFGPISICSDKNGYVFMLWKSYTQYPCQCYLVQYNHDGSQVLTMRKLEGDAHVVTVVNTSQADKLVVATYERTVYLYGLMTEDDKSS